MENNNNDKHHFFIGNVFNNISQIKILKKIQKKLKKKYSLKNYHFNNKFFGNLIYLGYLEEKIANIYMENIFNHLLTCISNKFNKLLCKYIEYKIDFDKSYYKISLKFTDENDYLNNIIVPYLYKNGIVPIYDKKKNIHQPTIDLIYYKNSNILKNKSSKINTQVPIENFEIDSFSLIKGTSVNIRAGTASLHDQMIFEEVYKYKYPFNGDIN